MATQLEQANEELIHEMSEAIWGADGSPDAVDEYMTEDFVSHEPDQTVEGRESYKQFERALRRGMPDLEGTVDLVVCEDDLVSVRYTATGTHTGPLWGIDPTNRGGEIAGHAIYRIEDGKVAECWHQYDRLGMFQQLGLVPEMG